MSILELSKLIATESKDTRTRISRLQSTYRNADGSRITYLKISEELEKLITGAIYEFEILGNIQNLLTPFQLQTLDLLPYLYYMLIGICSCILIEYPPLLCIICGILLTLVWIYTDSMDAKESKPMESENLRRIRILCDILLSHANKRRTICRSSHTDALRSDIRLIRYYLSV